MEKEHIEKLNEYSNHICSEIQSRINTQISELSYSVSMLSDLQKIVDELIKLNAELVTENSNIKNNLQEKNDRIKFLECAYEKMKLKEEEISKLENIGKMAIIITSPIVRMYFKKLTEDYFTDLIVISYNEVESNVELQSVGMVTA